MRRHILSKYFELLEETERNGLDHLLPTTAIFLAMDQYALSKNTICGMFPKKAIPFSFRRDAEDF